MRLAILGLAASLLAACDSPNARIAELQFGSSKTLATSGNLRVVTERLRQGEDGSFQPIVCTEPSPDYAIAFDRKGSVRANVVVPQGPSVDASGEFTTTEKIEELEGRSAAVLALRDGLYAACQSYVNGVIGHDAYAMILSQYGTLLVALVGKDGGKPGTVGYEGRRATLSAMLVACISRHDQSRLPPGRNDILDVRFCKRVLENGLRHALRGV